MKPYWIFECNKCNHILYVAKKSIKKILSKDCPVCGEESYKNWTIIEEGNFDKHELFT